ncbi:hypothetical protein S83_023423 [Arachis hypogaea]
MATKKITNIKDKVINNGKDQIKMPTKNSNEENHLVKMKANEHEGQSGKKPSRKKVPMKKSKVEGDKVKMNTNNADGQSKKLTNKNMPMRNRIKKMPTKKNTRLSLLSQL